MKKKRIFQAFWVVFFLFIGLAGALYLLHTKPKLKKRRFRPHPPLVKIIKVFPQSYQIKIEGFGTVYPLRTGQIVPEVSGKVVYVSPRLLVGGHFKRGEILLKIDPRDYEAALALAEAELEEARQQLAQLEAEAQAAKTEWYKILKQQTPPSPLVLKVPQLAAARARVSAAEAKVKKAALDLSRTEIKAPFDSMVVEVNVETGQYVSAGMVLGKIYDTSAVEVRIPLETKFLPWLDIPGLNASGSGSKALVFVRLEEEKKWIGRIVRAGAEADEKTRLLDLFVRVENPFQRPFPLLPGFFARVELLGKRFSQIFVLPRRALHLEDGRWIVWVVEDDRLKNREVEVLYFAKEEILVRKGLKPGDNVVLSRLNGPFPGMRVRIAP